jgi:hypothetical protein
MDEKTLNDYFEALQTTMQTAVAEAQRLNDEAWQDNCAAADLNAETQALLNQYEQEARHAAAAAANAWIEALFKRCR